MKVIGMRTWQKPQNWLLLLLWRVALTQLVRPRVGARGSLPCYFRVDDVLFRRCRSLVKTICLTLHQTAVCFLLMEVPDCPMQNYEINLNGDEENSDYQWSQP